MNKGLYIHIPFCTKKCIYCDFYSGGVNIADWNLFIEALLRELEIRKSELPGMPETLYIGGGTPSLIPEKNFITLIEGINRIYNQKIIFKEFTIEANPEDINKSKLDTWKAGGVNRVSLGVQSFNENELKIIGRRMSPENILNSYELLSSFFENVSVDVIYGLPSQTIESWIETMERIISLTPQHISAYSLMTENNTALNLLIRKNKLQLPDDNEWNEMWKHLIDVMRKNNYEHYEISNFCLKGFRSIHNSSYWDGSPYLGLGPSAHSYDGFKTRRFNPSDIKTYLEAFKDSNTKFHPYFSSETLTELERREEMIMTGLRTNSGIDLDLFAKNWGVNQQEILMKKARKHIERGDLQKRGNALFIKEESYIVSDNIISDLF